MKRETAPKTKEKRKGSSAGRRVGKVVRTCLFLMIVCFVLLQLGPVFAYRDDEFIPPDLFYKQPRNSIDVLFVGNSIFARGVSPNTLWEEAGISSYNRSGGSLSARQTYLQLKDALSMQNPKLVVLYPARLLDSGREDPYLEHRNMDLIRFSRDKMMVAFDITRKIKGESPVPYIFPVFLYHDRWGEEDFTKERNEAKKQLDFSHGQLPKFRTTNPIKIQEMYGRIDVSATDVSYQYDKASLYWYERCIKLCQKKNIQLLILALPCISWNNAIHFAARDLADRYQLPFLEMNTDELQTELKMNNAIDYYDGKHLNGWGATKVSKYIAGYLREQFAIPDRRKQGAALTQRWERDNQRYYKRYQKRIESPPTEQEG